MAGLTTTAVMAVSVTVMPVNPSAVPASMQQWMAPTSTALLSDVVVEWSKQAGVATPAIDSRIASVMVGGVTVQGENLCSALGKLVMALRHSDLRPQLKGCNGTNAPIQIVATR